MRGILSVLQLLAVLWLIRKAFRLGRLLLAAAVLAAVWPVTVIGAAGWLAAWLRGWPPARLYRASFRSLPMTGVYVIAVAAHTHSWQALALAPTRDWQDATGLLGRARVVEAVLLTVPWAVPAGLAAGGAAWQWRTWAVTTGLAGRTAFAAAGFDMRQWRRQAAAARGAFASPGKVPLSTPAGLVPVGPVIRAVGTRWHPVHAVPASLFARHMVIVGASGSGKTNLMIRLWAGWYACALAAARRGSRARCWPHWTAMAAPTPAPRPTAPARSCAGPGRGGWRCGRMKRRCRCGSCRPGTWRCCCSR